MSESRSLALSICAKGSPMDEEKAHGQHRRTDQTAHDSPAESTGDGTGTASETYPVNFAFGSALPQFTANLRPGGINYVTKEQFDAVLGSKRTYERRRMQGVAT